MVEEMLGKLLQGFLDAGAMGLAILAILGMAYYFHRRDLAHEKALSEERQRSIDRGIVQEERLAGMIKQNTEALTRNASSQEHCTEAIKEMGATLNQAMTLLHQMATILHKK